MKKYLILFFAFLYSDFCVAQLSRTRIVYDTIFVFDTIKYSKFHCPKIEKNQLLEVSFTDNNKYEFEKKMKKNLPKTATNFRSGIIKLDNKTSFLHFKKSNNMKEIKIFSLLFFAFQNSLFSQFDYSVSASMGFYNFQTKQSVRIDTPFVNGKNKTPLRPQMQIGVDMSKSFLDDDLTVSAGLRFHYLIRSNFEPFNPKLINSKTPFENQDKNMWMISLPVRVTYSKYRLQPFASVSFDHLAVPYHAYLLEKNAKQGAFIGYNIYRYNFTAAVGANLNLKKNYKLSLFVGQNLNDIRKDQPTGSQLLVKMRNYNLGLQKIF